MKLCFIIVSRNEHCYVWGREGKVHLIYVLYIVFSSGYGTKRFQRNESNLFVFHINILPMHGQCWMRINGNMVCVYTSIIFVALTKYGNILTWNGNKSPLNLPSCVIKLTINEFPVWKVKYNLILSTAKVFKLNKIK